MLESDKTLTPTNTKIVIPGDFPMHIGNSKHIERLKQYGDVTLYSTMPENADDQIKRCEDADIVLNSRSTLTWSGATLRQLPNLRLISTTSVGLDNIDLAAASELNIAISHQRGNTAAIVAEHEFALLLAVARRIPQHDKRIRENIWEPDEGKHLFLKGKTIGIIGMGNTGMLMAKYAETFDMKVISWTFNPTKALDRSINVQFLEFDSVLQQADVISIHTALSEKTHHLIGERELNLMKKGSIIINGSRGGVIDTDALVESLRTNHLYGAGLDVFEIEPLDSDHPLKLMDNVVLTPHSADATPEGLEYLNRDAVDHIIEFLEGDFSNLYQPYV